jgi:hypothetical protein
MTEEQKANLAWLEAAMEAKRKGQPIPPPQLVPRPRSDPRLTAPIDSCHVGSSGAKKPLKQYDIYDHPLSDTNSWENLVRLIE